MADAAQKVNSWALPHTWTSQCALGLGVLLLLTLVFRGRKAWNRLLGLGPVWFLGGAGLAAGLLSLAYLHVYLKAAPRIIDATTYLLQARLLAHGDFAFEPLGPLTSYQGRFLVATPDLQLAPLFPPGYPALLALGVLLGQPLWVGPVLGVLLSLLVYRVGREWFRDESTARLAMLLSVLSAVQRYHTADTMSHGLSALLMLTAVYCASKRRPGYAALAGLSLGWLFATRPVSALACAAVSVLAWYWVDTSDAAEARGRRAAFMELLALTVGVLPGVALLLLQQKSVTGEWLQSIQYVYYALSDFPADCFHYGFGSNVGCRFEHGEFIAQYMPEGYSLRAAIATTGRRIAAHLCDAANLEVFTCLLPFIAWWGKSRRPHVVLQAGLLFQCLVYLPFYFDGNYPGGGARFFADVLPFEHLLLASFLTAYRVELLSLGMSLIGFSVHSVHAHEQLRDRDGGRPMFESALLAQAEPSTQQRLLYVDTDHGFNLAFDAVAGWDVVRNRGDASDYRLWQTLGRPPSYRYEVSLDGQTPPALVAYAPAPSDVFQGASFWPALGLRNATLSPVASACFTGASSLLIRPFEGAVAQLEIELWAPEAGEYQMTLLSRRVAGPSAENGGAESDGTIRIAGEQMMATQDVGEGCTRTTARVVVPQAGRVPFWLVTPAARILASVEFRAAGPKPAKQLEGRFPGAEAGPVTPR